MRAALRSDLELVGQPLVEPREEGAPALLRAFVLVRALVPALLEAHLGAPVAEVGEDDGDELVAAVAGLVGDREDEPLGRGTSWYSPVQRISRRPGPQNIVARQAPPGRTSIETVESGISHSSPPNQSAKRSGSVHSRQTRSRGAAKTRVVVKPPVPNAAQSSARSR